MAGLNGSGSVDGAALGIVLGVWNSPCDRTGLEQARGGTGLDEDVVRLMEYLGTDGPEEAARALESMPFDRMFETPRRIPRSSLANWGAAVPATDRAAAHRRVPDAPSAPTAEWHGAGGGAYATQRTRWMSNSPPPRS
jgi:hypothetical protein